MPGRFKNLGCQLLLQMLRMLRWVVASGEAKLWYRRGPPPSACPVRLQPRLRPRVPLPTSNFHAVAKTERRFTGTSELQEPHRKKTQTSLSLSFFRHYIGYSRFRVVLVCTTRFSPGIRQNVKNV